MTRDEIYRKFGPMLLEAVCVVLFNEINELRAKAGLPLRTKQQAIDALESELSVLTEYNWMTDARK